MELDHLFFMTSLEAPEVAKLEGLGLTPTYRRTHVGQGTANVCYCFENAYLEVLWLTDEAEARSPLIAPMQLAERAHWRVNGANPFGFAWRPTSGEGAGPSTWPYKPPYLPADLAIEVARDSDALEQPMMFTFPGASAPREWPEGRRGALQSVSGYERLTVQTIWLPSQVQASSALQQLAAGMGAELAVAADGQYAVDIGLWRAGSSGQTLRLPSCELLA
jgi:hypothetical protein